MNRKSKELQVAAFVSEKMKTTLAAQLAPLNVRLTSGESVDEFVHGIRKRKRFEVVILPASLPDESWWVVWGEICEVVPRPEILVYAQDVPFELWTGVIESGGCDVMVEPFSDEEIREAVLRAAQNFKTRVSGKEH